MDSLSTNSNALKGFELSGDAREKGKMETGKALAEQIQSTLSGNTSYYYLRNARFLLNRQMAHGRYDARREFQDRLGFDGKLNYANIMWMALHIVNTIISKRVSAWMGRNEKIQVTAKDTTSEKLKNKAYDYAKFVFEEKQKIDQLQQASGMPLVPQGTFIAEDKDELDLWASEFNHLPEEIKYELGINNISAESGFFDVLKEKVLHDSAEVGLVCIYTDMNSRGEIYDKYIKPENAFYSASEYSDFRDTTWRGHCDGMKIKDLRRAYGKQFGGTLSEEQIWEISKYSKDYQIPDRLSFNGTWTTSLYRPYDECSVDCLFFQIRSLDEEVFPMKVNGSGQLVVSDTEEFNTVGKMYRNLKPKLSNQKNSSVLKSAISNVINEQKDKLKPEEIQGLKGIHQSINKNYELTDEQLNNHIGQADAMLQNIVSESQQIRSRDYNIYQGVYARDAKVMLEWGLKKNQIKPQDPNRICQADFSYSFYMYQNYEMRNLAIPEKVEEPYKNMCLTRFRIQQLIATAVPAGWAIDSDALQQIDYGLATENKDVDHEKLFAQTGRLYYKGRDAEGNRIEVPIKELRNSGFAEQMNVYIATFAHHYQVLKSQLGEDPDLATSAAQPRVTAENVQTSVQQGDFATDYMYDAYLYVMEEAARKKACLLNDSVTYGSKVYSHLLSEDDVKGREFTVSARMLPTQQEVADLQLMINNAISSTPDLSIYLDPFKILRIAKQDVKLAELFFRQSQKKYIKSKQEQAQRQIQDNADMQIKSAQAAEQAKQQTMDMELRLKGELGESEAKSKKEEIVLTGVFQILAKGLPIPPEWNGVVNQLIQNVGVPLAAENMQNQQTIGQAVQQHSEQGEPQEAEQQEQQQGQQEPQEQEENQEQVLQ